MPAGWLVMLLLAPCSAWAIKAPSPNEKIAIQSMIDQANEINKTSSSNPSIRDITVVQGNLNRETALPDNIQDHHKVARLQVELKDLKKHRDNLYLQAIRTTLIAYDLVDNDANGLPIMPTKTAVHPSFAGRNVHWIVVYKDDESRSVLNNGREVMTIPAGSRSEGGVTGADGVTTMYGRFRSPADLALMLYHEKVHFEQFTTRNLGDKMSFDEREEAAFQAQFRVLGKVGLTPAERTAFEKMLAGDGPKPGLIREHHDKAKAERLKGKVSMGIWGSGEPPQIKPRSKTEYAALLEESKDFDSKLISEAQALAADKARQIEIAHRDHDERLRNAKVDLARRSCSDPGSVTQAELDALQEPYDKNFMAMPPEGVGYCVARAFGQAYKGGSSDTLREVSLPLVALQPRAAEPPAVPATPVNLFYYNLHRLQAYAARACGTADLVPLNTDMTRPRQGFEFDRDSEDRRIAQLIQGAGTCEDQLFRKLIELIRAGQGDRITAKWVRDTAANYRGISNDSNGYIPPRTGGGGGDPCRDNGNERCP